MSIECVWNDTQTLREIFVKCVNVFFKDPLENVKTLLNFVRLKLNSSQILFQCLLHISHSIFVPGPKGRTICFPKAFAKSYYWLKCLISMHCYAPYHRESKFSTGKHNSWIRSHFCRHDFSFFWMNCCFTAYTIDAFYLSRVWHTQTTYFDNTTDFLPQSLNLLRDFLSVSMRGLKKLFCGRREETRFQVLDCFCYVLCDVITAYLKLI